MSLKFRMTPQGMKSMYNLAWSKGQPQLDAEVQAGRPLPGEVSAQDAGIDESERLLAEPFLAEPFLAEPFEAEPFEAEPLLLEGAYVAGQADSPSERMRRLEDQRPLLLLRLGYVF